MRINKILALSAALLVIAVCNSAQDPGFVRAWVETNFEASEDGLF